VSRAKREMEGGKGTERGSEWREEDEGDMVRVMSPKKAQAAE
jgi:hypothetical protein